MFDLGPRSNKDIHPFGPGPVCPSNRSIDTSPWPQVERLEGDPPQLVDPQKGRRRTFHSLLTPERVGGYQC